MIENASDTVQLLMLAGCFGLSLIRVLRTRSMAWLAIVCFFACMLLGNAYWLGFLIVFGETPHVSYVPDLSWIAGYIFLLMLLVESDRHREPSASVPAAWIPVAVCAACCVFYIAVNGYPLLNIADNGLMAALGFFAVRGLAVPPSREFSGNRPLYIAVLVFVLVEQALWMSSLLLPSGPVLFFDPYIALNYILTLSYASILACAWRSNGP